MGMPSILCRAGSEIVLADRYVMSNDRHSGVQVAYIQILLRSNYLTWICYREGSI